MKAMLKMMGASTTRLKRTVGVTLGVTRKVESSETQHPRGFSGGMRVCPCHHPLEVLTGHMVDTLRHRFHGTGNLPLDSVKQHGRLNDNHPVRLDGDTALA